MVNPGGSGEVLISFDSFSRQSNTATRYSIFRWYHNGFCSLAGIKPLGATQTTQHQDQVLLRTAPTRMAANQAHLVLRVEKTTLLVAAQGKILEMMTFLSNHKTLRIPGIGQPVQQEVKDKSVRQGPLHRDQGKPLPGLDKVHQGDHGVEVAAT